MPITVYTKPSCVQCTAVKRYLDNKGMPYDTVDITEDDAALARFKELGFSSAPVVESGDVIFAGFNTFELAKL